MIILTYQKEKSVITGGVQSLYLSKIEGGLPDTVRFRFPGMERGVLMLSEEKYRFSSGTVDIPFSALDFGIHMPRVAAGCELIYATHFIKDGSEIKHAPISEGAYENIRLAVLTLEAELEKVKSEVAYHREAIRGKELLKFN